MCVVIVSGVRQISALFYYFVRIGPVTKGLYPGYGRFAFFGAINRGHRYAGYKCEVIIPVRDGNHNRHYPGYKGLAMRGRNKEGYYAGYNTAFGKKGGNWARDCGTK